MMLRILDRLIFTAFALCLTALAAVAQDGSAPAMLVADEVWLEDRDRVVAEGSVEVLQGDTRLRATKVTYDRATDELLIEGPLVLTRGTQEVTLGDSAELDSGFRNGLVRSARMVLDQQLQIAANRLDRVDGRYSQLTRATASSCSVCGGGPPLWQIKAKRIIHDREEQQLYFRHARFEVVGVPIFYTPRLRMPDPTLKRATGFLIPVVVQNSNLGVGLKLPYFIKIGDHKDLTLTPYVSANTKTLEWRYRQAFTNGVIGFAGAVTKDTLLTDTRGYITGGGRFDLKNDFKLYFSLIAATDDAYLSTYGYSGDDLLSSTINVSRTRQDEYIEGSLTNYYTLRPGELNSQIPYLASNLLYERRFFPSVGGEIRTAAEHHSHARYSNAAIVGRDVSRLGASVTWLNTWTLPLGIRAEGLAALNADSFTTRQDPTVARTQSVLVPTAAITLRWPWVRQTEKGVSEVIEPVAMVAWSGGKGLNVANDESERVEFDEGNLLSLSRFPAPDRRELGLRGAVGVNWTRLNPNGWDTRLTFGSVYRQTPNPSFTASSGLRDNVSDLLIAGQLRHPKGFEFTARGLFGNDLDINKAEARATLSRKRYSASASYVWLTRDPTEARPTDVSEWLFSSDFDLGQHFRGSLAGRYNISTDKPVDASFGVTYFNECVQVKLTASRSFAQSANVSPSTTFNFSVGLRGFSASSGGRGVARTCR